MPVQPQYLAYVLEQLAGLPAVRPNRMFGGIGLYSDGFFFGLIDDDTLYFKTSPANVADYLSRGMPKFMPFPDKTGAVMGYHQVPADVIEDPEQLVEWARKSVAIALSSQAAKAAKAAKSGAPRRVGGKTASRSGIKRTAKAKVKAKTKPKVAVARRKPSGARRKPARKK
jgi:DNA transformation protein and related proteins